MTAKSLFNIILKCLGIYFFKDILIALINVFAIVYEWVKSDTTGALFSFFLSIAVIGIYCFIVYYLVFKTDFVIEKLRLVEKVPEDPIPFNIHRSTLLSIVVMIVGLLLITENIPYLIRGLYKWYQYNRQTRGLFSNSNPFDFSNIIVYLAEIMVGLLLIGNQRKIVSYIEFKQRKNGG